MNIYTHPELIRSLAAKTNSKTLKAYKGNFNYHVVDNYILEYYQEGTGMFPQIIEAIPENAKILN